MLVAPTGDPFFVRSLEGVGSGRPWAWLGRDIFVIDSSWENETDEYPHGPLSKVNLETGKTTVANNDVLSNVSILRVLPDGRFAVESVGWGDATSERSVGLLGSDFNGLVESCSSWHGGVTPLAPDGARVVCLEWENGKSAVKLHNLVDGSSSRIDTFMYTPDAYETHGWWDANSFVLTRVDDSWKTLWWAYDVSTKKLRDLNASLSDGTPAENARGIAGIPRGRGGWDR